MSALRLRDRVVGNHVIEVAFTGEELDVGDHAVEAVRTASLDAIARETGGRPVLMHQVHGADVVQVPGAPGDAPSCDALVTDEPGLVLLSRAADCVPVLVADPDTGWIGAAHAGRPGVEAGVVTAMVDQLSLRGAAPRVAWVGPHVCGSCYEVPEGLQRQVVSRVPVTESTTSWGTPALDLGAGVRAQLAASGVDDVRHLGVCTRESAEWPSYRRDGSAATRFAGLIWRHP